MLLKLKLLVIRDRDVFFDKGIEVEKVDKFSFFGNYESIMFL